MLCENNPRPDSPERRGLIIAEPPIHVRMTPTEMRKPGRKLWVQSGSGLLTMYGDAEPDLRKVQHRQGTMVRLTIPT